MRPFPSYRFRNFVSLFILSSPSMNSILCFLKLILRLLPMNYWELYLLSLKKPRKDNEATKVQVRPLF